MAAEIERHIISQTVGSSKEEQQVHNGADNSTEDQTTSQAGNPPDHAYGPHMAEVLVSSPPATKAPVREENENEDGPGLDTSHVEDAEEELQSLPPAAECDMAPKMGGKKRNSAWVFRPLKLKFRVKELEELYKKYVFRQHQFLLFTVCVVLVIVSLLQIVIYLSSRKVKYWCRARVCVCVCVCVYVCVCVCVCVESWCTYVTVNEVNTHIHHILLRCENA